MQIPKGVTMVNSDALMTLFFSQEEKKSGLAKGFTVKREISSRMEEEEKG
jgi:hypothetical protein